MAEREKSSGFGSGPWPAVAVLVALIGAGVALALAGWKAEAIIGFLTSVGVLSGTMLALLKSNNTQHEKLDKIETAVNGELDKRIEASVRRALYPGASKPPADPPTNRRRPF